MTNVWNAQNVVERQQWQEQVDQDTVEVDMRRQEAEDEERLRQEVVDKEKEVKKNTSELVPIPDRGVPT